MTKFPYNKEELIMFSEEIRKQPEPILSPESLAEVEAVVEELREEGGRDRVNAKIVENYISYINDLAAGKLSRDDE